MESFAAVVRTLLTRIRAIQDSHSLGPWPPSAGATAGTGSVYRVRPTAWGVERDGDSPSPSITEPSARSRDRASGSSGARRRLELTVYGLPVPRGLPST